MVYKYLYCADCANKVDINTDMPKDNDENFVCQFCNVRGAFHMRHYTPPVTYYLEELITNIAPDYEKKDLHV